MVQVASLVCLAGLVGLPSLRACAELLGEPQPTLTKASSLPVRVEEAPRVNVEARRASDRFLRFEPRLRKLLAAPTTLDALSCANTAFSNAASEITSVSRIAQDARPERRELVPLRVIAALSSPELLAVQGRFTSSMHRIDEQPFTVASVREQALAELSKVESQRFALVYHITHYREPRLVYMLQKNKREWIPGVLHALVAVHDASSGEHLCQANVRIENDAREEPTRSRLRTEVRDRLIGKLATDLRDHTLDALHPEPTALRLSAQ